MGRDYLKVGYYTESFFAERDIRYIAINDGVDSDKGDNDFTPFRNLFNDFYASDTSKKIRVVMRAKGNAGEHLCTNPPYGYMKDPEDKKRWIVDEEVAEVVKRIFALCIAGKGPMQIAKLLTAEHVLTVKVHYAKQDWKTAAGEPLQVESKVCRGDSCISVRQTAFLSSKPTMSAPTIRATRELVQHTLSGKKR